MIYDWDPDSPPPAGYRVVSTANSRAVTTGITLLGISWLTSLLVGSIGSAAEGPGGGVTDDDWTALYYPVVGPFIAIHTLDASASGTGLLIADGILQVGGAAGIIWGFSDRKYKLVRQDVEGFRIVPNVGSHARGVSVVGRF